MLVTVSCWCLLCLCLTVPTVLAWVPSAECCSARTSSRRIPIQSSLRMTLDPSSTSTSTSTSRRNWLSGMTAAAVGTWTVTGSAGKAHAVTSSSSSSVDDITFKAPSPQLCDPSVSIWNNPSNGRKVYLLGTAHISSESATLAGELVKDVRPEAVFVELDAKRVGRAGFGGSDNSATPPQPSDNASTATATTTGVTTSNSNNALLSVAPPPASNEAVAVAAAAPPKKTNPFDLRERALQAGSAAVGNTIKSMYKKLDNGGIQAGQEFVMAVREGQKYGAQVVLGDRDVEVTLRRLTEALSKTDLKALLSPDSELERSMKELLPDNAGDPSRLANEDLKDEDVRKELTQYVETMKAKENVQLLMGELKRLAPELYTALVAERDLYMANGLDTLNQFSSIVAVMGIAHVDGVENNLRSRGWEPVPLTCPTNNSKR